jgi:hypothetical protein
MNIDDPAGISRGNVQEAEPTGEANQVNARFITERKNSFTRIGGARELATINDVMVQPRGDRPLAAEQPRSRSDYQANIDVEPSGGFLGQQVLQRPAGPAEQHGDFERGFRHRGLHEMAERFSLYRYSGRGQG